MLRISDWIPKPERTNEDILKLIQKITDDEKKEQEKDKQNAQISGFKHTLIEKQHNKNSPFVDKDEEKFPQQSKEDLLKRIRKVMYQVKMEYQKEIQNAQTNGVKRSFDEMYADDSTETLQFNENHPYEDKTVKPADFRSDAVMPLTSAHIGKQFNKKFPFMGKDKEEKFPAASYSGNSKENCSSLNRGQNELLMNHEVDMESTQSMEKGSTNLSSVYYEVLWGKQSARKHKKWEGDGILIISKSSAVLKDLEGKVIARGTGHKFKEITELEEGSSFLIGGKECQIQSAISEKDVESYFNLPNDEC